jgi:8-oxo-dGTP diphosphatase
MVKREYPNHPVVGVGAIVLRKGKILLVKRGNQPAKGQWTVPGGAVEIGETLQEAVIRETKEETCLDASEPQLLDIVDQVDLDERGKVQYHYIIIDFLVQTNHENPTAASDAEELKWVQFADVELLELTPSFRRFFIKNKSKLEDYKF